MFQPQTFGERNQKNGPFLVRNFPCNKCNQRKKNFTRRWTDPRALALEKLLLGKMTIWPKSIYKLQCNSYKYSDDFLH